MPFVADRPAGTSTSKKSALKVNDLLFINEYMANGRNGTQAYRKAHPKCSYGVAAARASQLLKKSKIAEELARRVRYDAGITREFVEAGLLRACTLAEASGDPDKIRNAYMDCARLAQLLVEKHENRNINSDEKTAITDLVRSVLRPPKSLENLPNTNLSKENALQS